MRGFVHLFLGFGTLLLFAVIAYILIAGFSPETGDHIINSVQNLREAAVG